MGVDDIIHDHRDVEHEDDRRALITAFNNDLGDFRAAQVKIAKLKTDSNLAGHYHNYRELFYLLEGTAVFKLQDIQTEEIKVCPLIAGDRLLIPPRIAHDAFLTKGSILIGCTESPYVSPAVNDHKYHVKEPATIKEYHFENSHEFDISQLLTARMSKNDYVLAHQSLPMPCHDIMIEYNGGALLVMRKIHPVKDLLWCIGGRVERGLTTEDSLRKKVKEESNLDLENITYLGCARTFWETDPFGHGKGTDTINLMFFGRGKGDLKLDDLQHSSTIIRPGEYNPTFKASLHPYIQDMLALSLYRMQPVS